MFAVTGAFGYSGKYICQKLLDKGHEVITLTNSLNRDNPFKDKVRAYPFSFDDSDKLTESLSGVSVLFNTYWVRFNHKLFKHQDAVDNTINLFRAAKKAGVERIVHVSITNPSIDSHLEYFKGKAILEDELKKMGLSYAILRPTVIFGKEDILINNMAWVLRKFPICGLFGNGDYKLQPIYVGDLAEIALNAAESDKNMIINCIGPETFTYKELVKAIAASINKKRLIINMPPLLGYWIGKIIGILYHDTTITREEIDGLMSNLLYVETEPIGTTELTEWMEGNKDWLGRQYANELYRRINRTDKY